MILYIEKRLKEIIDYLEDFMLHAQNMDREMIFDELDTSIQKLKSLKADFRREREP